MEKRRRRPFFVTLVLDGVFLLAGGCFLQSGQAFLRYGRHEGYTLSVPAWYLPLTGALWGGLWLALGIGLARRREWARRAALIAIPLHLLFWLADWRLFSRSEIAIQSFGFDLALRLAAAGFGASVLLLSGRWDWAGKAEAESEPPRESGQTHVE
ncbi:MAG: hypothetical protein JW929_14730 [Anaerolineales bacterium]|nr:hypothetical protein [Anaerolineales bacterium]